MTRIYIPTFGRVDRQYTFAFLPTEWAWDTVLVCRPEEELKLSSQGFPTLVYPGEPGIGRKRQWILDQHDTYEDGPVLMMLDDDLKFYWRRKDDPSKFITCKRGSEEVDTVLHEWDFLVSEESPVVGLADRSGANRETADIRWNVRMFGAFALNVDTVRDNGWRFDRLEFMEDFDFLLQVLASGHDIPVMNNYIKGDAGSNASGGCSSYRTRAKQEAAALDLVLEWPDFVRLREARGVSADDEWNTRLDVTVQWAKAAKAGKGTQ